ncbi:MAG: hypothetical protein P8P48_11435, partial [Saprospiraceae bacterium]|nr:hypothetical protein [Saprospiraceae bacterium]
MKSKWLIALMILSKSVKSKHMLLFIFTLLFFSIELSAQTVTQSCDFDIRSQTNPSVVTGDGDTAGSLAGLGTSTQVVLIANGTNLSVGDGGISGVQLDNQINLYFRVFNSDFDGLDDNGDPIDETFTIQLDNFSYSISSYGNNTKQINVPANDATAMLTDGQIEVRYTNFGAGWSGADNGDNEFSIEFLNSNNIDYSYAIDTTTVNICLAAGPLDLGAYISGQTATSVKSKFLEVARDFPLQADRYFDPTQNDDLGYYRMKHEFVCNDEAAIYNEFKNVFVYAVPNATLVDDFVFNEGCSKEFGGLDLKALFTTTTTEDGVFSLTDSNQGDISSSGVFTPTDGFSGCV